MYLRPHFSCSACVLFLVFYNICWGPNTRLLEYVWGSQHLICGILLGVPNLDFGNLARGSHSYVFGIFVEVPTLDLCNMSGGPTPILLESVWGSQTSIFIIWLGVQQLYFWNMCWGLETLIVVICVGDHFI